MPAPLTTRDIKRRKGSDELQSSKRRVVGLARLDRDVVHLAEGPVLVRIRRLRDAPLAVKTLRERGRLDRATFERATELESPPYPFSRSLFATLEHDLAVLNAHPARVLARENRRAFARYGGLEREWLDEKAERLAALRAAPEPADWTDAVVELVTAMRGAEEGAVVARTFASLNDEPAARRAKAIERVCAIASAMETGSVPDDVVDHARVTVLFERLDAARDFPGRAKKRRTLDVLRRAIGWPELPAALLGDAGEVDLVEVGRRAVALWPLVRAEDLVERFATLVLVFRLGEDDVPPLDRIDPSEVLALRDHDVTLHQAAAIVQLGDGIASHVRKALARHVAGGLDLELLRIAADQKQLGSVSDLDDARSARAFITWSTRLRDHYTKHGLTLDLSPKLFRSLPKNEDLTVLTLCLLDQHADPTSDPIGTLDATLGLFRRLPARANALLDELRRAPSGEGRRLDPAFASFVDDDALLDRSIHIAKLAGEPALSAAVREDFDRNTRRERERRHLLALGERSPLQQARLDALGRDEPPRRDRTLRRLRARIERLLPGAYRRAMDETFRRLLREGWNIRLPKLTDAWRDAVRFWLLVNDNRDLLETLLRDAGLRPGQCVKDGYAPNRAWIASMRGRRGPEQRVDIEAWLAPRRRELEHAGARYVLELEEDPLEVLRMGIPFGTCLSLEDGCNAASTVLNAMDANKRVLYVRNAAGKIVARKLLALTDTGRIVGYRLYRSVGGDEERAIQAAVAKLCRELAEDCRAPLATGARPRKLHRGFWYDDGAVAFEAHTTALPAFCEAHHLEVPAEPIDDDKLQNEAEGWLARHEGDLELGLRVLDRSSDTPGMRVHDAWTIGKLGLKRALRSAASDGSIEFALFHTLAVDEPGLLRALSVAGRLPDRSADRIWPIVKRFPPSAKSSVALVDLALRAMRRSRSPESERGPVHLTLGELPSRFEDVPSALDLLDAVEPAWRWQHTGVTSCAKCVDGALAHALAVIEELYEAAPSPGELDGVIEGALMSRRRGSYAHRAALRVAARHVLPNGVRALRRFAALRPELMKTADAFAALVRQSRGALDSAPEPDEPPFPALRELVALPGLHRLLGRWDSLEGDPRSTWEAAWRRRRRNDPFGGYDAVWVEEARKKLVDPATPDDERAKARTLVMDTRDGEVVHWYRLVTTCARLGDAETAQRVLEEVIFRGTPFPLAPRVVVDLWRLGDATRAAAVKSFVLTCRSDYAERILAAEREGTAQSVDMSGLLEGVALELAKNASPDEAVFPATTAQLERALGVIVDESAPGEAANVFVYLEDMHSLLVFRDALARQPAARVAAIKEEIRKRDISSARSRTFFTWIRDIGGIETK